MKKYEISLTKFLNVYFNITNNKTRYLRHKDLKNLIPELITITCDDLEAYNTNICIGNWINVKDCDNTIICYQNPSLHLENYVISDFEKTTDFLNKPTFYRFKEYEIKTNYLVPDIIVDKSSIQKMEKWELLELKDKLVKYNKIELGTYYVKIALIKNELSKRKYKEENKYYIKKRGEILNDKYKGE